MWWPHKRGKWSLWKSILKSGKLRLTTGSQLPCHSSEWDVLYHKASLSTFKFWFTRSKLYPNKITSFPRKSIKLRLKAARSVWLKMWVKGEEQLSYFAISFGFCWACHGQCTIPASVHYDYFKSLPWKSSQCSYREWQDWTKCDLKNKKVTCFTEAWCTNVPSLQMGKTCLACLVTLIFCFVFCCT